MRPRIATIVLLFAVLTSGAFAGPTSFTERFALADSAQRERLLEELIAGTDEHDYFHCLHYQNTRNTAALGKTLAAWQLRKPGDDARRTEIQLREAVLSYDKQDPEPAPDQLVDPFAGFTSLQTLREYFALDLGKIVPPPNANVARDDLPSKLVPAMISPEAFMKEAFGERQSPLRSPNAETAGWLIATKHPLPKTLNRRMLLEKIDRPDMPNLLDAIIADIGKDNRGAFGSLDIHHQLTLEQLDALADSDTTRFRFVKPNRSQKLVLGRAGEVKRIALPEEFQNDNVLVELVGGGQNRATAYFANSLDLTISQNYGRLQVKQAGTSKALPKTYIKVFAQMSDGEVKFFKDGYTDLRGKFDYASISADEPDLDEVEKFAILVMHEEFGALVEEVAPPSGGRLTRSAPQPKPVPVPQEPEPEEFADPFDF